EDVVGRALRLQPRGSQLIRLRRTPASGALALQRLLLSYTQSPPKTGHGYVALGNQNDALQTRVWERPLQNWRPNKLGRARIVRCPADAPDRWRKGLRRSRPSPCC